MNINYSLIDSCPELEMFAGKLPQLIAEYRNVVSQRPRLNTLAFETMSTSERKAWLDKTLASNDAMGTMIKGFLIEQLAGHIYGIDAQEYNSMADVIAAIEGMEDYVKFA